jgi:iron complex transport system substrate-binding protein
MSTFRSFSLLVLLVMMASVILTACGDNAATVSPSGQQAGNATPISESATAPSASSSSVPASSGSNEKATTRIYKHMKGETEIPISPQRILAPYPHYAHLEALGLKSIGSTPYMIEKDPYSDMSGMVDIGQYNLELMLDLKPDLIIDIGIGNNADKYEAFSKIAPTVIVPISLSLIDSMRAVGDIVGKKTEAEAWIKQLEDKILAAKEKFAGAIGPDETVSIINIREKSILVYGNGNLGGDILYNYLGLKAPDIIQKDVIEGGNWPDISVEAISEYAGDHIFISHMNAEERTKEIMNSGLWKSLPAVKNNRVYELDFNQFYWNSPTSINDQIDTLLELVLSAKEKQ